MLQNFATHGTKKVLGKDEGKLLKDPGLELNDIQGDVLIGLQKNAEAFVFFRIRDAEGFKAVLREIVIGQVTTAQVAYLREFQLKERKQLGGDELLPLAGLNLGFTADGLKALLGKGFDPAHPDLDPSFAAGAAAQAKLLKDPVHTDGHPKWKKEFVGARIDGVFLLTGPGSVFVEERTKALLHALGGTIKRVDTIVGETRPQRGHEHFGFLDGVSQPGIRGLTAGQNPLDDKQGLPGQDLLWPGLFVFGYPSQIKDNDQEEGPKPAEAYPWMRNGSFMVFRRLNQSVLGFRRFLKEEGGRLGLDPELLGARMVGRWKSGAPLELAPLQDDPAVGGNPMLNNDFGYLDDLGQRRCPFAAHIRKTYPRDDLGENEGPVQIRRIRRSGIPFGPEVDEQEAEGAEAERGLLFVCYQTSIEKQFEFVQQAWANNPEFVFGKSRPGTGEPVVPGHDPVIGQREESGDRTRRMDEPVPNYPVGSQRSDAVMPADFVVPTAAGYFFMPSLSALRATLAI